MTTKDNLTQLENEEWSREARHLRQAIDCYASTLKPEEIQRFHRALMYNGPGLDAINKIVKGEL